MDFTSIVLLSLIAPVFILIIYIMTKTIIKNKIPDSRYNPFDYITGQTNVQFQEQKEEKEEEDEHGDDKDKNVNKA
ncbi:DUF3951 domain-containing protein [Paenibacillus radicis (ex Xue et al. 2023)]|uniref:DUF3951 domain-containing protein n=1 Tax=Paenibacillus radicis (ex Xue et al. 2023) TaxID=2972489 RepID=A0ABT1YPE8_9BACL|nr:DUF3951 domain-containing protein [Paenibacillus radicis (ex Xue et al. 2023)]MCR8634153.1 DUF3951 domain-containing protein [Paenibacillus radicis (ex Xue et al. 2023)]